ncbi:MAG: alpha/beta hydrolase [Polyangiaceae bacterium]|nr:alpha/beta hydrolase [Polyangiaceae bacterium]
MSMIRRLSTVLTACTLAASPVLAGCLSFHQGPMPGEPQNATFVEVEGARVRYRDEGEGTPVVLIHGFASSLETWDAVIPSLVKNHRVLAVDLKGFGWTDRPEGDYSPWAEAKLVRAVMERRGIKKAAIVAHSWGSSVALALALGDPDRVTRIALYDAWVYEDQIPTFFRLARREAVGEFLFGVYYKERPDDRFVLAFHDPTILNEALAEAVEKSLERPGTVAAALAAVRGQQFAEVEKRYKTIQKPVLLLWGREDVVTTLDFGERLSKELPNARLVVYPKCGHFPMIEAIGASNTELAKFLAEEAR